MRLFPKRIRDLSFWHYQLAGWLSVALLQVFVTTATLGHLDQRFLFNAQLQVFLGFLLTSLLRFVYQRVARQRISLFALTSLIIACSLVVAVLLVACFALIETLVYGKVPSESKSMALELFSYTAYAFPDKLAWSALYFGIKFWRDWQDERELAERSAEEAQRVQLQTLRYQLSPRFLFDALHSIRALVDEDAPAARQAISDLSEFLRYSLVSRNRPMVPLHEELEAVRLYLSVEQRRFEEKLKVQFNNEEETKDAMIPSFLIIPLVEHAFQSGLKTARGCIRLEILTGVCGETLEVTIIHSGNEPHGGEDGGKLEMVNARLREFFGDRHRLIRDTEGSETILKLELPFTNEVLNDDKVAGDHC